MEESTSGEVSKGEVRGGVGVVVSGKLLLEVGKGVLKGDGVTKWARCVTGRERVT